MGRKRKFKKQDILDALKGSYGIVSEVADKLGVDWHTADDYIKLWPETLQAQKDENERYLDLTELKCIERVKLDFVEGKAIARIKADDGAMIRFYLATKGKKRGYTYDETTATAEAAIADTEVNISVNGGEPAPAEADA